MCCDALHTHVTPLGHTMCGLTGSHACQAAEALGGAKTPEQLLQCPSHLQCKGHCVLCIMECDGPAVTLEGEDNTTTTAAARLSWELGPSCCGASRMLPAEPYR